MALKKTSVSQTTTPAGSIELAGFSLIELHRLMSVLRAGAIAQTDANDFLQQRFVINAAMFR